MDLYARDQSREKLILHESGSLHRNVRGIVLVTILQEIWILLVAAYLLRAQSSSSREQADGRSI